jgi:nucleoside-diphosphate-sugar epimerase
MSKIFLTGGSGFIGGAIARLVLADGHELRNFDLIAPDIADQQPSWVEGDVRDKEGLMRAVAEFAPDYLIHLASDIDVQITQLHQFTTTIDGTRNVVEAVQSQPQIRKFVHVSTQFAVKPGIEPRDEEHLDPYTVYGEAKAETERIVRGANLATPWLIARPTIIWGPRHPPLPRISSSTSLIAPIFIR